jgi:hypothetical protein
MKTTLSILLAAASLALLCHRQLPAQAVDATGTWVATGVPYEPWTVKLKQDGTKLTGTMEQNGGLRGPADIYEGSITGKAISFKCDSPGGARTITFTGTMDADSITLKRSTAVNREEVSGNGLFGASADPQLIIRRAAATSGTQHWVVADGVAYKPWTLDLKIEGSTVTGSVSQAGFDEASGYSGPTGPYAISEGKLEGSTIDFKVVAPGGVRTVTFHGTRSGDQIAFTRKVEVAGDPGRDGVIGASGAKEFVAKLTSGAAPASPPAPRAGRGNLSAAPAAPAPAQAGPAGRWQAKTVPNGPWTFDFALAGDSLTGTVQQQGTPSTPVSIAAGKAADTTISFKILSPDGERVITFNGRVAGNEISFVRQINPLANGTRGGNDLYGGSAPLQFVASRSALQNRFNFRGIDVDVTSVQSLSNLDAIVDSIRKQIDLIEAAAMSPEQKTFIKSVPLVTAPSPSGSDNAAYGNGRVVLTTISFSPEKPIILHELMHAYHDLKLPNGFGNADVERLYQQAKAGGQFPANSYMLSNRVEYFAMMASVFLHGSAARDPFTRQAIKEKQPDCYAWLEKEFGPR